MGTLITGLLIALAVFFCVRSIVLEKIKIRTFGFFCLSEPLINPNLFSYSA